MALQLRGHLLTALRVLAAVAVASLVCATPASAATVTADTYATNIVERTPGLPTTGGAVQPDAEHWTTSGETYLPIMRWVDATGGFHSRLNPSVFNPGAVIDSAQRDIGSTSYMNMGNGLWALTTWSVETATTFDVVDSAAGGVVDKAAGNIGQQIVGNPTIVAALIVMLVASLVWKASRARASGSSVLGEIVRGAAVVGLMVVMVNGAMATTFDEESNTVTYGTGSPGWIVSTLNTAISTAAGSISVTVADAADPYADDGNSDVMQCPAYVRALEQKYRDASGTANEANTAMAMNRMWEMSGLQAWINVQYGPTEDGKNVFCHLLEQRAGVPALDQLQIQQKACEMAGYGNTITSCVANTGAVNQSLALSAAGIDDGSATAADLGIVGWAACKDTSMPFGDGPWSPRDGWEQYNTEHIDFVSSDCSQWWNGSANISWWTDNSWINTGANPKNVAEKLPLDNQAAQRTFLYSAHGNRAAGSSGGLSAVVYVFSALMNLAAFGTASILILIAKLTSVLFMVTLFFVMTFSLWPGGTDDRMIAKYTRQFIGMTFMAFGYSIILSMLALMASIVMQVGVTTFGAGSLGAMAMSGLAPVVSWMTIVMVFKNIFKSPNPMSLRGGLAYAGMAGAAGGAAASFVERAGRGASSAVKSSAKSGFNSFVGGRGTAGGKAGTSKPGYGRGGMSQAIPGADIPTDSTVSEVLAARAHRSQQAAAEAKDAQAAAAAAGSQAVVQRTISRMDRGVAESAFTRAGDNAAAYFVRQRTLHNLGQDFDGPAPVRAIVGPAVRLANASEAQRAAVSGLARAVAARDQEAVRRSISEVSDSAVDGVAAAARAATSAAGRGLTFAAQHPLKATGRVAGAGVVAMAVVTPGGLPLAAAGLAAQRIGAARASRRQSGAPMTAEEIQSMLDTYRARPGTDGPPAPVVAKEIGE